MRQHEWNYFAKRLNAWKIPDTMWLSFAFDCVPRTPLASSATEMHAIHPFPLLRASKRHEEKKCCCWKTRRIRDAKVLHTDQAAVISVCVARLFSFSVIASFFPTLAASSWHRHYTAVNIFEFLVFHCGRERLCSERMNANISTIFLKSLLLPHPYTNTILFFAFVSFLYSTMKDQNIPIKNVRNTYITKMSCR